MIPLVLGGGVVGGFLVYVWIRYSPIIGRIFEDPPIFRPLRIEPETGGEDVRFATADGLTLEGTYFPTRTERRVGVILFCHEFLSDRWSFRPYTEELREIGFDLFTFDFRNHGGSETDARYIKPLQWVSDLEVKDVVAAVDYLKSRPDRDPAGIGMFGISRGGGAALCVAADDPAAWAVVTDGAFPTRGTMSAYIMRWKEIYVTRRLWKNMPLWIYSFAGWAGRLRAQRRLGRLYPDLERAVARLAPRPWLLIHGELDKYIEPAIARTFFAHAGQPKESWIVPKAKHNRCRDLEPDIYRLRILDFFRRYAPRRPTTAPDRAIEPPGDRAPVVVAAVTGRATD
jgi:pimeloyl-ACP methyl ester carboxylesterase